MNNNAVFLTILIAFFTLIGLVIIHELGHFLTAKKFGVKVEEFGIGYPPRLFGKKIGETLYSFNLLPFGAFVKIYGHEKREKGPGSFSEKPIYQRAFIILGGVISFWIVAAVLLSVVMAIGYPSIISDEEKGFTDAKVQILAVSDNSPAQKAGIKVGDIIRKVSISGHKIKINKVKEVQDFSEKYKGQEVGLTIQRGKDVFNVYLSPRINPPKGEGAMGVALVRTALKSYPWYQAPIKGVLATIDLTFYIVRGWKDVLAGLFSGVGLPSGVEVRGVVGVFELFIKAKEMGAVYFLQFISIIAVSLAVLNILPIPALDGGWFLLLMIEKIRGRPLNHKIEQSINSFFFIFLIFLMIWVTIKDIARFF